MDRVKPTGDLTKRAAVFAALSDPTRLQIVDLLTVGDLSSTELQSVLDIGSNLVAHHLRVLERSNIVERTRSEFDRRRSYVSLRPEVFDSLTPREIARPERIVFVCTANSARSQIAEALWRETSTIPALSAGTRPASEINPSAVSTAKRHGLTIDSTRRPVQVEQILTDTDFVISVCDSAHEGLAGRDDLHWSIPDPAALATREAFDEAFALISRRIDAFASRLVAAA